MCVDFPSAWMSPLFSCATIRSNERSPPAGPPFLFRTEQVPFGHHFQNRTDILGHAAVNQDEALLKLLWGSGETSSCVRIV